jgi:hypothetical protein
MFDKSRELNFPLFGGSSIPFYYRKPEIELDIDTPPSIDRGWKRWR